MAVKLSRTVRALHQDSPRFAHVLWMIAFVMVAIWLAWFIGGRVSVYQVSKKARIEVAAAAHTIAPLTAGKINTTWLVIGKQVKAGEILVQLDDQVERLALKEVEAKLQGLPAQIAGIQQEINSVSSAKLQGQHTLVAAKQSAQFHAEEIAVAEKFAQENAKRLHEESEIGGVARIEAMKAAAEADKLKASSLALNAEVVRVERDAMTRAEQDQAQIEKLKQHILSFEAEQRLAEVEAERLRVELRKRVLRAPIAGRVGEVLTLKTGSYVAEGQRLASIVPQGQVMIVAEFAPADVSGKLRPGQDSVMRLDGFPWAQYGMVKAKVSRVASEVHEGLIRVELTPIVDAQSQALIKHGLPGSVEVNIETLSPMWLALRSMGQWLDHPQEALAENVAPPTLNSTSSPLMAMREVTP